MGINIIGKLKIPSRKNLIFIILFIVFGLIPPIFYIYNTLHVDEATFLVIGNYIKNGSVMYKDYGNNKFPGIFYLAALVFSITGKSFMAARILTYIIQAISAIIIFVLGTKIKNKNVGMIAAILFLIGVYLPDFQGYLYMTESYVVFFSLVSILFFLKDSHHAKFISGLALGIGMIFKQTAVLIFGVYFLFYLLRLKSRENRTKNYIKNTTKNLVLISSGAAIPLIITFTYFLITGAANEMLHYTVFSLSGYDSTFVFETIISSFLSYLPVWLLSTIMVIFVGYSFLVKNLLDEKLLFLILWILLFFIPALSGTHRVLFIIPPVVLSAAYVFIFLYKNLRNKQTYYKLKCFLIIMILLSTLIASGTNIYLVANRRYTVNDQIRVAHEIEQNVDGEIYIFPFRNYIYFFSNLTPGTNYLGGVYSKEIAEKIVKDLQANNVSCIVANKGIIEQLEKEKTLETENMLYVYNYIKENYQESKTMEFFIIYKLKSY